ncbi:hypothetical protein FRZ67_15945 [Panacibacter ginsenosidivorans]|uniref:Uncharacterized protein n=1 Tax=Panacibacter ginsenosidivorans TaxID=1813871 RepID=A0A5B8VCJ5_9BACT|nr:DUF5829 family protein [Panacibacter ginsenosidivorans]QEC68723.1 hypothetical protein FRZ67_15945 [Panacibacter ginsenosidivorans]
MRMCLFLFSLFSLSAHAQKFPKVNFNHFYLVIDSADLVAIKNSDFIKNEFAAMQTKTTIADSAATWTGTYLFGLDNYFEIFDSSGVGEPTGIAGIGFSVDGIGEIQQLDTILSKKYKIETRAREKQYDDKKVPWSTLLDIDDSAFNMQTHIYWWVMEYKPEYYDYNHWKYTNNQLTRTTYLSQYAAERKNKIFKRFTGITLKTTMQEKNMLSGFLLSCGYKKIDEHSFASPEDFIIHFKDRNKNDRYAVESVSFECNEPHSGTEKISVHIQIEFQNNSGRLVFE